MSPFIVDTTCWLSGDYVLADRDGIVIIPQALVEEVTLEAEGVLRKANLVRRAILEGVDPVAAYLQYGSSDGARAQLA